MTKHSGQLHAVEFYTGVDEIDNQISCNSLGLRTAIDWVIHQVRRSHKRIGNTSATSANRMMPDGAKEIENEHKVTWNWNLVCLCCVYTNTNRV